MRGCYGQVGQDVGVPPPQLAPRDRAKEAQEKRWLTDAIQAVKNFQRRQQAPFYGYYFSGIQRRQEVHPFASLDDAMAWFDSIADERVRLQRMGGIADYDYLAIFNPADMRQALWHEFPHFWDPQMPAPNPATRVFLPPPTIGAWPYVGYGYGYGPLVGASPEGQWLPLLDKNGLLVASHPGSDPAWAAWWSTPAQVQAFGNRVPNFLTLLPDGTGALLLFDSRGKPRFTQGPLAGLPFLVLVAREGDGWNM